MSHPRVSRLAFRVGVWSRNEYGHRASVPVEIYTTPTGTFRIHSRVSGLAFRTGGSTDMVRA